MQKVAYVLATGAACRGAAFGHSLMIPGIGVGAPADIVEQDLRIEAFFPSDDVTEECAREHLAGE